MLSPQEKNRVFRILDANRNRAIEGLRAIEEFARFVLANTDLSEKLKRFRHQLCNLCSPASDQWLMQRDSQQDVGIHIEASGEYSRSDFASVVGANCSRVTESLRALEEYTKTLDPELGKKIESLRYLFYEIEKEVKQFVMNQAAFGERRLYVLTSACEDETAFANRIEMLTTAGVDIVQLREKNLHDGDLLRRAKIAAKICHDTQTLFIVNDRPDIAVISQADGVHLGQDELSVRDVRLMVPISMKIGVSTHSLEQAKQAVEDGADYIGVGPTFASRTKCFSEFTGTELLNQVAQNISIPAFAIGGIQLDNLAEVIAAGFQRIAVSNAIHGSDSPMAVISEFKNRLEVASCQNSQGS